MPPFPPQQENENLVARCEQTLTAFRMLDPGAAVLVGVSGGPDSMALLQVLVVLSERYGYRIGIAHLNHGIRGADADQDAQFVEDLAKSLHLPYYFDKIDLFSERNRTGFCLEEAGREARYSFFNGIADRFGFDKIAVGHHREDDAELILMNLLRGSGLSGLSGIRPSRDRVIRPMIHASRREILKFLETHRIPFVQDHTNNDTGYRRNHIRHHLMPALLTYNPRVVETLSRLGEVLRAENDWVESLIDPILDQAVTDRAEGRLALDGSMLQCLDAAPVRRIIRRALLEVKGNLRRIGFSHVEAITALMGSRQPASLDLPDRIRVRSDSGQLIFSREKKSLRSAEMSGRQRNALPFDYRIARKEAEALRQWLEPIDAWLTMTRLPRETLEGFPGENAAVLDWDRLEFPLTIRNRRAGDRFAPLGMSGRQKITRFFANNRVPEPERDRIPLVVSGGRVVWIAGFRIDERVKVTDATQNVLKMELIPATGKYNTHTRAEGLQVERL